MQFIGWRVSQSYRNYVMEFSDHDLVICSKKMERGSEPEHLSPENLHFIGYDFRWSMLLKVGEVPYINN